MDRTLPMGDFILKLSGLNFFIITNKLSSTLDASHISVFFWLLLCVQDNSKYTSKRRKEQMKERHEIV